MSETSSFAPEEFKKPKGKQSKRESASASLEPVEAMASALAEADEKIKKAQRIEASRQRILARLDQQIAEKEAKSEERTKKTRALLDKGRAVSKAADKEKLKGEMGALKGKLAENKEEKQKLKEKAKERGEDAYESFEGTVPSIKVISSEGGSVSGEIHNDDELKTDMGEALKELASLGIDKKEENAKLDRVFAGYEKARTIGDFKHFMLKELDMMLTKERAESDPVIKKYLGSKFDEEKTGLRYEDLVHALPTEADYKENALGRKPEEDAEKEPQRTKYASTLPELQEFGVVEEKPPIGTAMRDLRKKLKKNADSKKPSKDTEEAMASLKNLPPAEENIEEEIEEIRPEDIVEITDLETPISKEKPPKKKSLTEVARESAAKEVPFLKPETREALVRAAQEEEDEFKRKNQKFAPRRVEPGIPRVKSEILEEARARVAKMPEADRKRAEAGPLVKKLSGMSTKEVAVRSREITLGKQKSLDQIAERYVKKLGTKENAHKFLMGPEAKGWFKGGQRKDQENYKKTFKELHG